MAAKVFLILNFKCISGEVDVFPFWTNTFQVFVYTSAYFEAGPDQTDSEPFALFNLFAATFIISAIAIRMTYKRFIWRSISSRSENLGLL